MKLSSKNKGIQKTIGSLLNLISKLKQKKLLGEEYDSPTDYLRIYRYDQCTQKIVQDLKYLLPKDILNDDSSSQNMPTLLKRVYEQDWSFVENSEKLYAKFFWQLEKFSSQQLMLVENEYIRNYNQENSDMVKNHLIAINRGIRDFYREVNSKDSISLTGRICNALNRIINHSTYNYRINSQFFEKKCKNNKIVSRYIEDAYSESEFWDYFWE
ncbi:hypothetical protein HZS_5764 [Henneguya salminicola]|nr:hypothetical protein HZS_5764 [Henneguya salminicola]